MIFAGDPCQPPPIGGTMPHEWLLKMPYTEEVNSDYRSKDQVRELKRELRGHDDQTQCTIVRKRLRARSYQEFLAQWEPKGLVLSSRRAAQSRIQKDLRKVHKERYPNDLMPVTYKPRDTRWQKRDVRVPCTDIILENAVTNDKAWVPEDVVEKDHVRTGAWDTV